MGASHTTSQLRHLPALSTQSFLLQREAELSKRQLNKGELWKEQRPRKEAHPMGANRAMIGPPMIEDAENQKNESPKEFLEFHAPLGGKVSKIGELSLNMASSK